MQAKRGAELLSSILEEREFKRKGTNLSANLIVPAEEVTLPCQVLDLSGGGARVSCSDPPPLHTYVILCIDGFGRLESVTRRFAGGQLGLQFVFKETKRQLLLAKLYNHAFAGSLGKAGLRRHVRLPSIAQLRFTSRSGDELPCEVIDISMRGISLRTAARPPVNDLISIGLKYVRVVRHHQEGIAVECAEPDGSPTR